MKNNPRYIGLVHAPIKNKRGEEGVTSVTNMDIHDIARSARSFGFDRYFIITPIKMQHELVGKILEHWNTDTANQYNPDRQDALSFIKLAYSIEDAAQRITELHGKKPKLVVTGANFTHFDGDEQRLAEFLRLDNDPMFLLFGTGWGLTASVVDSADFRLEPIFGKSLDGYNHLSVRSAVAIYCDRLTRSL
jgi:hypothetical protein